VTFGESVKRERNEGIEDRLGELKKELMESIEKEMSEVKKDGKWYAEMEEEWRNKVKSWEGRIRILEDRMEEVERH